MSEEMVRLSSRYTKREFGGKRSRQRDRSVLTRRTRSVLSLESGSSSGVGGRGRFGAWLASSPPLVRLDEIAMATASRGLQSRHQQDKSQ